MTPEQPLTGCPRCNRSAADSIRFAIGAMGLACHHLRMTGQHDLVEPMREAVGELVLLLTPANALGPADGEQRRAA